MLSSTITTLVLLAVASVNASPMLYGKRAPQIDFDLADPGLNPRVEQDSTTNLSGFPFQFQSFKREEKLAQSHTEPPASGMIIEREPQFPDNSFDDIPTAGYIDESYGDVKEATPDEIDSLNIVGDSASTTATSEFATSPNFWPVGREYEEERREYEEERREYEEELRDYEEERREYEEERRAPSGFGQD